MDFTNKLIVFRDKAGLKQEEVADRLGISKSSYSRKENGVTQFTYEELEKLFEVLNITWLDLREMKFPIIHEEKISPDLLDELDRVIEENNSVTGDWNINREQYNRIQRALNPVLEERNHSFDFPDLNLDSIPRGTTVKEVLLDVRAERLINEALKTQKVLAHAIFGAEV